MIEHYYMPVHVITGRDCILQSSKTFGAYGKKALILCGKTSADTNGALADVTSALDTSQIAYEVYRGISPNPTVEQVVRASEVSSRCACDVVIAIGGGSVIDAAKVVAILTKNDLTEEELFSLREFGEVLPIIAIPTTAGTGSEVTQYAILTDVQKETKSFVVSTDIFPKAAFLDGKYLVELPPVTTIHTAIDALSHAIEGYLAVRATAVGKILAMESIRLIAPLLTRMRDGSVLTIEDRDALLYASMLAGIVISQSGTTAVHAMGYSLTYFKHIDHGRANGLVLPGYLAFLQRERAQEVSDILVAMEVRSVPAFRTLCHALLQPVRLTEEEIVRFAEIASNAGNIQNTFPTPTISDLQDLLREASDTGECRYAQ